MTSQLRRTIDPTEIVAIEIECPTCFYRATWPIGAWNGTFQRCSNCKQDWPVSHRDSYLALLDAVEGLRKLAKVEDLPFHVRFELKEAGRGQE